MNRIFQAFKLLFGLIIFFTVFPIYLLLDLLAEFLGGTRDFLGDSLESWIDRNSEDPSDYHSGD